jgi:outer membrane protein TolC
MVAVCLTLGACNDTTDLAPASPDTPWRLSDTPQTPAAPRAFDLPPQRPLPWRDESAAIDQAHRYTLAELIDMAQRRNKDTRIAWEQARQAAIGVGMARAAFLPELTASALGGYQHIASPFPARLVPQGYITADAQEIFPELAIKYLLIDFGRGREAAEQSAAQLSFAANVAFTGAHQRLILSVARAYFTLDGVNAQLQAARHALDDARRLQQSAEALYGRGLATVVAVQLARRSTAQATYDIAQATAAQHDANYSLLQVLELPPTTKLAVQNSFDRALPRGTARTVDQMMDDALRQRAICSPVSPGCAPPNRGSPKRRPAWRRSCRLMRTFKATSATSASMAALTKACSSRKPACSCASNGRSTKAACCATGCAWQNPACPKPRTRWQPAAAPHCAKSPPPTTRWKPA